MFSKNNKKGPTTLNNSYRTYWWILVTYVLVQFSGFIGAPLLLKTGYYTDHYATSMIEPMILSHWTIISFTAGLLIILFLLKNEMKEWRTYRNESVSIPQFILWCIGGFFLAMASQAIAGTVETSLFNVNTESENTATLVNIAKVSPIFILVTCVVGPILEELVFRKVIFSTIQQRTSFIIAALLSSLIFAVVHFDFSHILVYTAMGLVFSFLYVKTKTILVPIVVHATMNSFVMIVQLNLDSFQHLINEQQFIHWFL